MSKKHLSDLNLNGNQILNPSFHKISGVPSTASTVEGQFYYDTDDNKLKFRSNDDWRTPAVIFNDLEDVDVSGATDTYVLEYNSGTWTTTGTVSNASNLGGSGSSYYLDAGNLYGNLNSDVIDETGLSIYPLIIQGNELISGGVSWVIGLTFSVSDLAYTIGGTIYNISGDIIGLSDSHPTLDRIDVIAADIDSNIVIVEGVPSANPIRPDVEESSQVQVSFVTIRAGQQEPDIKTQMIFDENLGVPDEWNATYSNDFTIDGTNLGYNGSTYSVDLGGGTAGAYVYFSLTQSESISIDALQIYLKSKNAWDYNYLRGALYTGGTRISGWGRIEDGFQGFDSSNTTDYQIITFRSTSLNLSSSLVDEIRFEVAGTGLGIGFTMDKINIQYGIGSVKSQLVTVADLESGLIGAFGAYSMFGNTTVTPNAGVSTPGKVLGTTTLEPLTVGFDDDGGLSNRLKFTEPDTRTFEIECNFSAQSSFSNNTYQFYLYKNGTEKIDSSRMTSDFVSGGNVQAVVIGDFVEMSQNDYIELWCQNDTTGTANKTLTVESLNFRIKKIN